MISEFTHSSHSPSKNKENAHHTHEYEHLKSIISRNEQLLIGMRKELSLKVNKTEFLSAMSSKVSLSDITNLTNNSLNLEEESSFFTYKQTLES